MRRLIIEIDREKAMAVVFVLLHVQKARLNWTKRTRRYLLEKFTVMGWVPVWMSVPQMH